MQPALRAAARDLPAPCGIIDLDAFDRNTAAMVDRAGGKPIRVASKSLRTCAAIDRILAHPGYHGILAFTLPEAILQARRGLDDIVLGYPVTHAPALQELREDADLRERITLMIDSVEHLDYIDAVTTSRAPLRVAIDLDVSFRPVEPFTRGRVHIGVRRSSLREAAPAALFARSILARPGYQLVGAMAYEAQVAGVGDGARTLNGLIKRGMRALSVPDIAARRAATIAAITAEAGPLEFVNGGGTGSLETTAAEAAVTELTAGSGFFSPGLFDGYHGFRHEPAAYFGLDVVRKPAEDIATLHGGGWIASGPAEQSRQPTIAWPEGLRYEPLEGAGEVQTPVRGPAARGLEIGDRVWMRHSKAGEVAERLNEFAVIQGGIIVATWKTYRGDGFALL